jgi:uncharacterized membrane protein YobD (UPF0266 family)
MQKEFNTEKFEKRLKNLQKYSLALIGFGLIILLFKDYDQIISDGAFITAFLDSAVFLLLGGFTYFNSKRQLTNSKGSYLNFGRNNLAFKDGRKEVLVDALEIASIEINRKNVNLKTKSGEHYTFNLENYVEVSEKKDIKANFEELKNKIV